MTRYMPILNRTTPARDFVPADYTELYRHYYHYVVKLCIQQSIDWENADDVAQNILMKFMEKKVLEQYDPEKRFNGHTAAFSTFLAGFVLMYVRHPRDRQNIHKDREGMSSDGLTISPEGTIERWVEVYGPSFEEEYAALHEEEFLTHVRGHLAQADTGRKDTQLDLVKLFDAVARQVAEAGKYSTTKLMEEFGVTRSTIHNWLNRLRVEVAAATEGS